MTDELKEQYVSLETAILLKEKGFDWLCTSSYGHHPSYDEPIMMYNDAARNSEGLFGAVFPVVAVAPTQAVAMRWLREEKDCPIEILWFFDADDQKTYWEFRHHKELGYLPPFQYFETYEDACEAAIKFCVGELI